MSEKRSLEWWPAAQVALLHDNRVRSDYCPDSDSGMMLLTDGAGHGDILNCSPLRKLAAKWNAEINVCACRTDRIRQRTALTGSLSAGLDLLG